MFLSIFNLLKKIQVHKNATRLKIMNNIELFNFFRFEARLQPSLVHVYKQE